MLVTSMPKRERIMRKKIWSEYAMLLIVAAVIYFLQEAISKINWAAASLFDYSAIDSSGVFMMVSVHHVLLALFSLLLMAVLHRTKHLAFGLKPLIDQKAIQYTVVYCTLIFVYYVFWYMVVGVLLNSISGVDYALTRGNVIGTLGFQLLLSGPAEELWFRGLSVTCLQAVCAETKKTTSAFILFLSSLLFMMAHMKWSAPISSQWYSLLYVFLNGIAFGFVYMKTKHLVYPMVMHSISNVVSVGGCYLYMILLRNPPV